MKRALILIVFLFPVFLFSQQKMYFGIHGGVGTDLNLGLGVGVKASIIPLTLGGHPLETSLELFYSHSEESYYNGYNTYVDTTDMFIFGVLENWLVNYRIDKTGFFYILGIGVTGISVEWVETSDTDTTLGTPYGTSGSQMSEGGVTGGSILNLGIGYKINKGFDVRLEIPILFIFANPSGAASIAPAVTLMTGYRF